MGLDMYIEGTFSTRAFTERSLDKTKVALEELCSSIPMEEYYHSKKVSQEQYDLCKAKILTRKNLQGDKN